MSWGFAENTLKDFETTELKSVQVLERSPSRCGVELIVSGGRFSPDVCQFEIILGGPSCGNTGGCKPDYAIVLRNSTPNINEINSVVFFNIREFRTGTYRVDPGKGLVDFRGQLIDKGAIARHLLSGVVSLDLRTDDKVYISCDVLFDNDITVKGSGLIGVKRVAAP